MTSNLNIIVQQRDNVLMVPNRAVRAAAPGAAANLTAGAGATTNPIITTHTTTNTVAGAMPTAGSARGQSGSQGGQRSGAGGAQNGSQNGGFGGTGRRPTRQQFVTEATILEVLGGMIGVALGAAIAHFISASTWGVTRSRRLSRPTPSCWRRCSRWRWDCSSASTRPTEPQG
jgi:hypothetical protein